MMNYFEIVLYIHFGMLSDIIAVNIVLVNISKLKYLNEMHVC